MKKPLLVLALVLIALAERLWFDLGWNVELVTVSTLLVSAYWGRWWGVGVVLTVMGISDVVLGMTNIALFTWSGFAVEAIGGGWILKQAKGWRKVVMGGVVGLGSSLWFYLWTNLGVWLLDTWGMYSRDAAGLAASYIAGLPFLKAQALSNLVIVPIGFGVGEGLRLAVTKKQWLKGHIVRWSVFYGGDRRSIPRTN